MKTLLFHHSGKIGDVILALPAVKAICGDHSKAVLYVSPNPMVRPPFTKAGFDSMRPLLMIQSYIEDVIWCDQPPKVDHDLNEFRRLWHRKFLPTRRITDYVNEAVGLCPPDAPQSRQDALSAERWLVVDEVTPLDEHPVLVARCGRYENTEPPWVRVDRKWGNRCCFIGLPQEYHEYCSIVGHQISYAHTKNCLEVARLIAGCKLLVTAQSSPYSIAEGLKKDGVILSQWLFNPNCIWDRHGVKHWWKDSDMLDELFPGDYLPGDPEPKL